jgi:hypothetical protein
MGLLNPYVQAAKDGLEALQKIASEALIHSTLFGRDALLSIAKVGLVRGQIFCRLGLQRAGFGLISVVFCAV